MLWPWKSNVREAAALARNLLMGHCLGTWRRCNGCAPRLTPGMGHMTRVLVALACTRPWVLAGGEPMNPADQSFDAYDPAEIADPIDEAALAEVMRVTPLGAGVLAGTAVALLVLGYLAIYLLVFLPRGAVG